jgi:hypothetical protein
MQTLIRTFLAMPLLVGLLALGAGQVARAADVAVKGEVRVILAKEAAGEYDPKLKEIAALGKPPFNAFKSMKVLSTNAIELAGDKAVTVALPNGSTLQIKLLEHMADGRNKVQWSIETPGKKGTQATMNASPSEPFFIGGPSHDGGTLVLIVQIGEGKKK